MTPILQLRRLWNSCRRFRLSRRCAVGLGIGASVVALTVTFAGTELNTLETNLVGRWQTAHGNVDTSLELHADRTVTVTQRVRLALRGVDRTVTTRTVGRWRVAAGHLRVETWSASQPPTLAWRLRTLFRAQRWPARGALERDWRLEACTPERFLFVDGGSGTAGRAVRPGVPTEEAEPMFLAHAAVFPRAP